ncbi:MAG: response regulator [Proteobacteria bacterium]|nr:response regulator [Pseudomonadota bacterium]
MTRRYWPFAALFSISLLAVGGAVYEWPGLVAGDGSILPLLAWLIVWLGSLILLVPRIAGIIRNAGGEASVNEIVDALPFGLALYDPDGKLRHCNETFQQAFPDLAVRAEFSGEHEMADGRWMRLERRELDNGAFVVTALDVSRIAALEADFQAAGKQFRQFLSTAADWIWETDILHRFVMARTVAMDAEITNFGWMTGRSPAELATGGEGPDRQAVEGCMRDMDRRQRLNDVSLTLDAGDRIIRVRLNGLPRYDGNGEFLGYRGVGIWEPAAAVDTTTRNARPVPTEPAGRLLIVDDSSTNRMLAMTILRKMGYEADAVADGREAVEAVRDGDYAAVLMDIWMPGMDGFEATAAIRDLPEPRRDIPVIAMTAHTGAEERRRCLAAEMDDHVEKPIDRAALAAVLRRLAGSPANLNTPAASGAESVENTDSQPATSLVSDDVLNQLRNDAGPALVGELIAAFMAETDERLVRIAVAIDAGNHEEIAADGHSMKSSSGTFGALPLQALSARLEAAATQGDTTALAAAHAELPDLVSETWREFAIRGFRRE